MTRIFSTPMAYSDESETSTEQELKQKNVGSGASTNTNCGTNSFDDFVSATVCPGAEFEVGEVADMFGAGPRKTQKNRKKNN